MPLERLERLAPIAIVLALAAAIRLIGLGANDFWFDEALEVARDRLPAAQILLLSRGPDPPLYRLLQSPLASRTSSELLLRLPSALYSVATIALVWCWIVRLGDRRLALLTAALLAIAPVQVYYAQEVSQYALAGLVGAWLLLAAQRVLQRGAPRDWALLAAAFVVAVCTYYGLLFLIGAIDLVLLRRLWQRRSPGAMTTGFVAANTLLGVVVAALSWLMLAQQFATFARDNLTPWIGAQPIAATVALIAHKLEADVLRFLWIPWSELAPRVLLVLPGGLAVVGIAGLWRRDDGWRTTVEIFALAIGAMLLASGLGFYPFGNRYALFLAPLFFLFVAHGLQRAWRWPPLAIALGIAVVSGALWFLPNVRPLPNPWTAPHHENLGRVLDWVEARQRPGDAAYLYYGALPAYRLYRERISARVVIGAQFRHLPDEQKVAQLRRAMQDRERFFLVLSHVWGNEQELLVDDLTRPGGGYCVTDAIDEAGAFAALLQARSAGSSPGCTDD